MSALWAVFRKELHSYFVSPLAYAFLSAFLFLAGLFFYLGITRTGEASLRVMVGNLVLTLLFVLPMLTMRHFAEERRNGTYELLLTSPLPLWALIAGKWAASLALCLLMFLGTGVLPLVLAYYGEPDWGVIATSYLALVLAAAAFTAAGLFSSSLGEEPVASGVLGILLLLPFWLAGAGAELARSDELRDFLESVALLPHLRGFTRGVVDTADVTYFAAFVFVFLFLTYRTLESRRWR